MTPGYWERVSRKSTWCVACRSWSPPHADPDAAITWRLTHPCPAVIAAAA